MKAFCFRFALAISPELAETSGFSTPNAAAKTLSLALARIAWLPAVRIIPSRFPPIDLFERIAAAHDAPDHEAADALLAAGVAAMMSTASGALIAAATVARVDVVPTLRSLLTRHAAPAPEGTAEALRGDRIYVLVFGVVITVISIFVSDTVTALTIAYDILVGGLLVAILGGLVWRRGTSLGAALSMLVGSVVTVASMAVFGVLAIAGISAACDSAGDSVPWDSSVGACSGAASSEAERLPASSAELSPPFEALEAAAEANPGRVSDGYSATAAEMQADAGDLAVDREHPRGRRVPREARRATQPEAAHPDRRPRRSRRAAASVRPSLPV